MRTMTRHAVDEVVQAIADCSNWFELCAAWSSTHLIARHGRTDVEQRRGRLDDGGRHASVMAIQTPVGHEICGVIDVAIVAAAGGARVSRVGVGNYFQSWRVNMRVMTVDTFNPGAAAGLRRQLNVVAVVQVQVGVCSRGLVNPVDGVRIERCNVIR